MSTSSTLLSYSSLLDGMAGVVGVFMIYSGVIGTFVRTLEFTKVFGFPNPTAELATFLPAATGRNLGAGFYVWTLLLLRERRVLGIFIICWCWAGVADTKILYEHPQGTNLTAHIRNTIILLVTGTLLILDATS
ncbi:hypothetical protein GGR54DRAFT_615742 [Hypoxylon sp. NC1633]|nr:hypothetical protein GGR54DRAFT_615742 [Hypoxylon sp. NC1633]